MNIRTLMYHDVLGQDLQPDDSGFPGGPAARYKVTAELFDQHLKAISAAGVSPELILPEQQLRTATLLSFDDGGIAAMTAADILERYGWRGYFLITTDWIGKPGFLGERAIFDLHQRGHVIGTHSCSHPDPMAGLAYEALVREWCHSTQRLSAIVGAPIQVASVPGGAYSRDVAKAADEAGIRILFNSEPTSQPTQIGKCWVLGRYMLLKSDNIPTVVGLAKGFPLARARITLKWLIRKWGKRLGGPYYYKLRRRLLPPSD